MRLMRLMHRSTSDNLVPSEAGRREAAAIYIGEVAHGAGGTVLRSGQDRVEKRRTDLPVVSSRCASSRFYLVFNTKQQKQRNNSILNSSERALVSSLDSRLTVCPS